MFSIRLSATLVAVCTSIRLRDIYEHLRTVNVNRQNENVGLSFFTEKALNIVYRKEMQQQSKNIVIKMTIVAT